MPLSSQSSSSSKSSLNSSNMLNELGEGATLATTTSSSSSNGAVSNINNKSRPSLSEPKHELTKNNVGGVAEKPKVVMALSGAPKPGSLRRNSDTILMNQYLKLPLHTHTNKKVRSRFHDFTKQKS